nr:HupE/UreJ family protein [Hoeflea prorocentri]
MIVVVLALLTVKASAHESITFGGALNAGLLHPWLPAEQTLVLFAAGLLLGRYGGKRLVPALCVFAIALCVGFAVPPATVPLAILTLVALSFVLAASALVGLDTVMPYYAVMGFAAIAGLIEGSASAPDPDHWSVMTGLILGSILRAVVCLGIPLLLTDWLVHDKGWFWARTGVRILAAWLAAVSLLMLALSFAQP